MSTRFDNRSVSTFKKDIYFSTKLEKYFFNKWLEITKSSDKISISSWDDNGCGNDGEFIPKGNTAGADYKITGTISNDNGLDAAVEDEPLEIKWVPTAGKFTLKENDLKSYMILSYRALTINCPHDYLSSRLIVLRLFVFVAGLSYIPKNCLKTIVRNCLATPLWQDNCT